MRTPAKRLARALLAATLGCVALARAAGAEPPAGLTSLLELEAPISAAEPGLVRLVLPAEVIQTCRPDLADLRVFDAAEREVAFLVDSLRLDEELEVTERFGGEVSGLRRERTNPERGPGVTTESYSIAAPPLPPRSGTWELVFESAHDRFVREVTIVQLSERGEETLASAEPLFRLDAETRRLRLPLPPLSPVAGVMLRVEIAGKEDFFLEPQLRFESGRRLEATERGAVSLEELGRGQGEGRTVVSLERPPGLVPAWLRVETATGALQRSVAVYDEQQGSADRLLGTGTLYRLPGARAENLLVYLRPARGETLRVEVEDGDSPALEALRFDAVIRRPALVFELPAAPEGGVSGTLRFGGGRVRRADYDLASLLPRGGATGAAAEAAVLLAEGSWLPLAALGPIRFNPRFDASPALAFAMHPGAELDPRGYSHRRRVEIAPSPEGLSRLALAAEDAALLRTDLGDLRIVGADGRQWPYLPSAHARSTAVVLAVSAKPAKRRHSRYALTLPAAPLRVDSLSLRSPAAFFDRSYRLLTRDAEGLERVVGDGRLVKQALRPRPVEIAVSGEPVASLELLIDDGDDAPLAFSEVTAQILLPEIFLVAPQGSYALLLGNPEVPAPRYELERVREVVLAASSSAAEMGALEANPAYSLRARLGGDGGPSSLLQTGLVWGTLLLAVAVLGAVTLRVVRQAPAPGNGDGGSDDRS